MPGLEDIVTLDDPPPPAGASPWVGDARPETDIEIRAYDPGWPERFAALEGRIRDALGFRALVVEHVGSTSVPGLPAKPIVDIDLTVARPGDEAAYLPALESAGFELRVREPWWHEHRCLRPPDRSCNLHVFGFDSPETVRHRIFRDWLRANPEDRALYAETKLAAATAANRTGEHVMDYNRRKEPVIREIYARAFRAAGLLDG